MGTRTSTGPIARWLTFWELASFTIFLRRWPSFSSTSSINRARGLPESCQEGVGLLGSRQSNLAVDDEERHALHPSRLSSQASMKARKMSPGAAMRIVVNDQVLLSDFRASDKPAL